MDAEAVINRDRIQNVFGELETRKALLASCTQLWNYLSNHFSSVEESLLKESQDLDSKLETLDAETKKTLEALEHRENAIPERESEAIARVEERKQASLSEFEKPGTGNLELSEGLRSYCKKMDSVGLLRFMSANRKDAVTVRSEVSDAIAEAVDPPRLVLDVIEDFVSHKSAKDGISDRRWACTTLLQRLVPSFESDGKVPGVAASIVERAGAIAEEWKVKIDSKEGGEIAAPEAAMFLQMVVFYRLQSRFDEEFLKKLVLEFPSRREIPKIAVGLWLGEKMGDIIDELVKSGKEIEAVYFAYESGLTERFTPVSLLKSYLRNSRKNANVIAKNNHYNAAATVEANALELNSLRAIIKCLEDHKLESEFSFESLKRRLSQLEKAKMDKKKSMKTTKPQNKRARGGGGGGGGGGGPAAFRASKAGRVSNAYPSFGGRNPPAHQNTTTRYSEPYKYPNQAVYDGPVSASYMPPYGAAHTQNPPALPQQYAYPPGDAVVGGVRAGGSYGAQTSYGAYDYSASAATPSAYQPSYPQ